MISEKNKKKFNVLGLKKIQEKLELNLFAGTNKREAKAYLNAVKREKKLVAKTSPLLLEWSKNRVRSASQQFGFMTIIELHQEHLGEKISEEGAKKIIDDLYANEYIEHTTIDNYNNLILTDKIKMQFELTNWEKIHGWIKNHKTPLFLIIGLLGVVVTCFK